MLTVEPVTTKAFRTELYTEGKISINEDLSTPVFPPYAGRVTRLTAKPGDFVQAGQPLFFIEANDMVQAQNDFLSALALINKAKARVVLTEIIEKQNRRLMETKAGSMRDSQVAEADVLQAKAELRVAETTLEAVRNRLRILGKTEEEISTFQEQGRISPETPILAPISGTVVQRRIGPGQYVSYTSTGAVDPVFVIGNMSTVWLVALRARERSLAGTDRPADGIPRAGLPGPRLPGDHRLRRCVDRPGDAAALGARHREQRELCLQAGDVRKRRHLRQRATARKSQCRATR